MVTRCLENNIFAVTANRFGSEIRRGKELTFTGASQITAPRLEIVASASKDSEELTIVEIDINAARRKTVTKVNHLLNDRRSDLYGDFGVHF
jgi:predicted amidohydrolase